MCHMGVTTTTGKLYQWGCNKYGQLGNPDIKTHSLLPNEEISPALAQKSFIEIACGLTHTLTLTRDGYVFAAGDNDEGQCGVGKDDELVLKFQPIEGLSDFHVTKIVAGCHSAAITSEEHIYVWGTSTFGQFLAPERSVSLNGIVDASIGRSSGAAVDRDGKVWTWGYNEQAQLGLVDTEPRCIPTLVKPIKKKHVYAVAVGAGHVIAIGENKIQPQSVPDDKRAKSSDPIFPEEEKQARFQSFGNPIKPNPDSKSQERMGVPQVPNLTNQRPQMLADGAPNIDLSFNSDSQSNKDFNSRSKGPDLVDAISEAAKKLLDDPNSYYHNLKKEEKAQVSRMMNNSDGFEGPPTFAFNPGSLENGAKSHSPVAKSEFSEQEHNAVNLKVS